MLRVLPLGPPTDHKNVGPKSPFEMNRITAAPFKWRSQIFIGWPAQDPGAGRKVLGMCINQKRTL